MSKNTQSQWTLSQPHRSWQFLHDDLQGQQDGVWVLCPGGVWLRRLSSGVQQRMMMIRRGNRVYWHTQGVSGWAANVQKRRVSSDAMERSLKNPPSAPNLDISFPGVIKKICVQPREAFQANDVLLLVEAMKMQFKVLAPQAGAIDRFLVEIGQRVEVGQKFGNWVQSALSDL